MYTHLVYVHRYDFFSNSTKLFVYGVNTEDIFHTMGEMQYRMIEHIERISYVKLTSENVDTKMQFWKSEGVEIREWRDRYPYKG